MSRLQFISQTLLHISYLILDVHPIPFNTYVKNSAITIDQILIDNMKPFNIDI